MEHYWLIILVNYNRVQIAACCFLEDNRSNYGNGGGEVCGVNHQLGIGGERTGGTWSREGEDGVIAGVIFDGAAIEGEGIGRELIEISGGIARLNGVGEFEDAGATAAAVGGEAIGAAGFQLQLWSAACGVNEDVF